MSMKKKKLLSYLFYNIITFSKVAAKTDFFSGKISWVWSCSEIPKKFRLMKKSVWMMLNKVSSYLYILGNDN